MSDKLSQTIEDYLSFVYILERDNEPVVGARLAEIMGVTPPTVTNTLKRMARDGLLVLEGRMGPRLTEKGLEAARSVMRRHMLTEWMLARMLSWSKTHDQAHALEHAISPEVERALSGDLHSPQTCPHGNPLPGYEHVVASWVPLTSLHSGEKVTIRRVHELAEQNQALLTFLESHRLMPGQQVTVGEVLPFNQTISLLANDQNITLGFATAQYVYAER